jgi:uncharacterized glyoxalase superfamily protein PhnB
MHRNRSIPDAGVIPELAYRNVDEAARFLCAAFGFEERLRIGDHRVQLLTGNGAVVVMDVSREPADARPSGHGVLIRVNDVDAHHARAAAAGANITVPPQTHPYGERQYSARDPEGHNWTFSETVSDVDPAEWGGELKVPPAPRLSDWRCVLAVRDLAASTHYYMDVLGFKRDFGDSSDGWSFLSRDGFKLMLGHCRDAMPASELGDHSWFVYLTVQDVDGLYKEITSRGADATSAPTSQPWGLREFGIRTPEGHRIVFGEPISRE